MFSEDLAYDKQIWSFRTNKINSAIALIVCLCPDFAVMKKGQSFFYKPKSLCAEKEGFEPSVQFPVRMFSKHVLSATQASLRFCFANLINFFILGIIFIEILIFV